MIRVRTATTIELAEREAAWRLEEAEKFGAKATRYEADLAEVGRQAAWWAQRSPGHPVLLELGKALESVREVLQGAQNEQADHELVAADMTDWAQAARDALEQKPDRDPVGLLVATGDHETKANPLPNGVARLEMSLACTSGQHERCQDPDGSHPSDRCQCPDCCGLAVATIPAEREDTEAGS